MNKENADKRLDDSREDQLKKFCPLICNTCRKDCVCYMEGTVAEIWPDAFSSDQSMDYRAVTASCIKLTF